MGITETIIDMQIDYNQKQAEKIKDSNKIEDKLLCLEYKHFIISLENIKRLHLEELKEKI